MSGKGYSKVAMDARRDEHSHAGARAGADASNANGGKQAGLFWIDDKFKAPAHQHLREDQQELPSTVTQAEYDKWGCPNIWGNEKMARLWETRLYWLMMVLFIGWNVYLFCVQQHYAELHEWIYRLIS